MSYTWRGMFVIPYEIGIFSLLFLRFNQKVFMTVAKGGLCA
jgi:hypothetical protein